MPLPAASAPAVHRNNAKGRLRGTIITLTTVCILSKGNAGDNEVEAIEIDLLLEAVARAFGYDFRNYGRASVARRIRGFLRAEGLPDISSAQARVLHEPASFHRLLSALTVSVTSMFRDPDFFLALRTELVPMLRTYPFLRIWCAGCATGEEVYSLAILLREEDLYRRSRIYATDLVEGTLQKARDGVFSAQLVPEYERNYRKAGGHRSLEDYYTKSYDHIVFRPELKQQIVFAQHSLVSDGVFNEFHLILCRNVMIYFDRTLQERVHKLIYDSLVPLGFLGLGNRESVKLTPYENHYVPVAGGQKIFKKVF